MLDKGIVIAGDIQINLLDIELLTIKLRLLIASVDQAREMGINWWETDSVAAERRRRRRRADQLERENRELRERLERLERRLGAAEESEPVTDELARWAARRAADLIARAEAEVVAELKAALLARRRRRRGETAPAPRGADAGRR